jgi:xylulokinase
MAQYILAQDIGITSCKAILCTLDGVIVRRNIISYAFEHNDRNWAWQNPGLWWTAFCKNCKYMLADIDPEAVVAVAVCGHMMGCLPVGNDGEPLCDATVWGDYRAAPQAVKLSQRVGPERIYRITGIHCSPVYSASRIMWVRENRPDIYEKTEKFLQPKDLINFKLTGCLLTDETDAGFTQLYDLYENRWSQEMLDAARIDASKMPEPVPYGTALGRVTPKAADETGLSTKTLVVQGMGDGRATVVGSGIRREGEGCTYMGAAAWVSQATASKALDPSCALSKTTLISPGIYANGGATLGGKLCVNWFGREFLSDGAAASLHYGQGMSGYLAQHWDCIPTADGGGQNDSSSAQAFGDFDRLADLSKPGSNGLLFLPYLSGEQTPWWNATMHGAFLGMKTSHTKADFCRSILEGINFNLAIIKDKIERMVPFTSMTLVGTSIGRNWEQILSDIYDMPIIVTNISWEVDCVAVAVAAGIGAGVYQSIAAVDKFHHTKYIVSPSAERAELYRELLPAFEDCYYALRDISQHLARF